MDQRCWETIHLRGTGEGGGERVESRWSKGPENLSSSQWIEWRCLFPLLTSGKKERKNVIRDHFPSFKKTCPTLRCCKVKNGTMVPRRVCFVFFQKRFQGALQNCEVLGPDGCAPREAALEGLVWQIFKRLQHIHLRVQVCVSQSRSTQTVCLPTARPHSFCYRCLLHA